MRGRDIYRYLRDSGAELRVRYVDGVWEVTVKPRNAPPWQIVNTHLNEAMRLALRGLVRAA